MIIVTNSTSSDIDLIFQLFNSAIEYQKKNGYDLWPQFSKELIGTEISQGRNWKVLNGNKVIGFFSVLYNDPVIWTERDKDPAVYLHRIVVNPEFKGHGLMQTIKNWSITHAKETSRKYVRMDTWGNNKNLREYYINSGFNYIGQQYLQETPGLPSHYGGSVLSLFEIEV
jgi:GNAT superfamily N-acetyltransferase